MVSSVTVQEIKEMLNRILIIDVRATDSDTNKIGNAVHIPLEKLYVEPDSYLNKNDIYYIYCDNGVSTPGLCRYLNQLGYHTVNIIGGYEAWLQDKNENYF